ncbi:phage holin family protein [Candidatus Curtissbacteria bacterium]|nr:phage holin family protein [Candidatus Curtissbacteria bacterium]
MLIILVNWLLSALTILAVSQFVPGFVVDTFTTALLVALVLGILNALVKPILIILTLPINIITLGLFTLVINAFLLILTTYFVHGFQIQGFGAAVVAALLLWLINTIISSAAFPIKS